MPKLQNPPNSLDAAEFCGTLTTNKNRELCSFKLTGNLIESKVGVGSFFFGEGSLVIDPRAHFFFYSLDRNRLVFFFNSSIFSS
jgi:hypothetical protein